jgi:hypothetical protein
MNVKIYFFNFAIELLSYFVAMKKRNLILMLIFSLLTTNLLAQYQISKENYTVSVKKFPTLYVEPEKRTYYVNVTNYVQSYFSDDYFTTDIVLPGWEKVSDEKEAFLVLNITVPKVYHEGTDFSNKKTENAQKGGAVKIESHWFPIVKYSFAVKCQFKCPYESFEKRLVPTNVSPIKTFEVSESFPIQSQARNYVTQNIESIKKIVAERGVKDMMKIINEALQDKFFATEGTDEFQLGYLDQESSPFYETMVEAKKYMPQELKLIQHDSPISNAVPGVSVWIEKFKFVAGELKTSNAAQKKAKEEMIRNVAILYYMLEDFENATLYAQILRDSFGNKDGDRILKLMTQLQSEFVKFHKSSRHY